MKIGNGEFWLGDCLERMSEIPDGSVDMVLCDLPYGTTACKWDEVIPFEPLWSHYWRVCKPNAAVVLTAAQPFTSALVMSQIKRFKYRWVWDKVKPSTGLRAKYEPLRHLEDVIVFGAGKLNYRPQMTPKKHRIEMKNDRNGGAFGDTKVERQHDNKGLGYPKELIAVSNADQRNRIHPTQKPVALFEYLIKTYTDPGHTVLDNCAGSGTTAVAAERTGRRWICIEREPSYYYPAVGRVWSEVQSQAPV